MASPAPAMSVREDGLTRFGLACGLIVLFIWIGIETVAWGLSDYFAPTNPLHALYWRADSADALTALAQQELLRRDGIRAAALARRAVALSPLQVPAISVYAAASQLTGHGQEAERVVQLAGQLGWRDGLTQLWLCSHRLVERNYDQGFSRCDALLRRMTGDGRLASLVFSMLMKSTRDPHALRPLADRLAASPSWRTEFLGYVCSHSEDMAGSFQLLNVLRNTGGPPTVAEIGCYVQRLASDHRFADADQAWRRLAHRASANGEFVHDGKFDDNPVPAPLGWTLSNGVGWTATVAPFDNNPQQNALRVEYNGFSAPQPVRQLLVLPPGDYVFSVEIYAENPIGAEDFAWLVTCIGGADALARINIGNPVTGRWQRTHGTVHVPTADCPAQWLDLAAEAGDERTDVIAWFADVSVAKISRRVP